MESIDGLCVLDGDGDENSLPYKNDMTANVGVGRVRIRSMLENKELFNVPQ